MPCHAINVRLKPWRVNAIASIVVVASIALATVLVNQLPQHPESTYSDLMWFALAISVLVAIHELIHGFCFCRWGCLPWSALKFGFNLRRLVFYCHCSVPVNIQVYRTAVLGPFVAIVPVSLLAVLVWPVDWLAWTAATHFAGCLGDLWIFAALRKFGADATVVDCFNEPGCDVYSPTPSI